MHNGVFFSSYLTACEHMHFIFNESRMKRGLEQMIAAASPCYVYAQHISQGHEGLIGRTNYINDYEPLLTTLILRVLGHLRPEGKNANRAY